VYVVTVEDEVLKQLHRAARDDGRNGVSVPSRDLDRVARHVGGRVQAERAIERLVQAGRVKRARRDLLVLPDVTGLLGVDLVDLVDAVAPRAYLITAGRALAEHELTDQYFFGVAVLVPKEVETLKYRQQTATFFRVDPSNIWGAESEARPCFARPERAIVDALNHPRYGVSLTQALDALLTAESRYPMFLDRLLETVVRYSAGSKGHGSRAAARRMGLIVEELFGEDAAAPYLTLIGSNRSPVLLRPGGSSVGEVDRRWRVRRNIALTPEKSR
jgi:predicted transcriptional regulator of viral defense system